MLLLEWLQNAVRTPGSRTHSKANGRQDREAPVERRHVLGHHGGCSCNRVSILVIEIHTWVVGVDPNATRDLSGHPAAGVGELAGRLVPARVTDPIELLGNKKARVLRRW